MPRRQADWDLYAGDRSTYAAIVWFGAQAKAMRQTADNCSVKNEKLRFVHRARLYRELAESMDQLRMTWRKISKSFFATQRHLERVPPIEDKEFSKVGRRYAELMRQAMSSLPDDPIVRDWAVSHTGDKVYLGGARKGLGKGFRRPYGSVKEMELDLEIMALYIRGFSLRKIQSALVDKGVLQPRETLSHTAIRKRIKAMRQEYPFSLLANL